MARLSKRGPGSEGEKTEAEHDEVLAEKAEVEVQDQRAKVMRVGGRFDLFVSA